MTATKSPQNFTGAERLIAMVVSKDGLNFANDNDIEAGSYLSAAADFVLRNDLSDASLASLGRAVLQQYLRDVAPLVAETDREMTEAVERCEADYRAFVARTPNHLLPRNGGVL